MAQRQWSRSLKHLPDRRILRWRDAGVIDEATAERILAWERAHGSTDAGRFGRIALGFGGLLLGAGVLLFVAANWDLVSPWGRFALLAGSVATLHVCGALSAARSPALAITLHAVGTAALGGGIFLAGQVFNLGAHWPEGILLWAFGAAVAAWLLRDWPQVLWAAVLVPAWVFSEWVASEFYGATAIGAALAGLFVLSGAYVSAIGPGRDSDGRRALARLGSIAFIVLAVMLPLVPELGPAETVTRSALIGRAWVPALAAPLLVGVGLRGRASWPLLLLAVVATAAVQLDATDHRQLLALQVMYAATAVCLVAWGMRERHRLRINLGVLCFALVVVSFYFSSIFDKLGRSVGLIGLGLLFIGGGWLLERSRRRLVTHAQGAGR